MKILIIAFAMLLFQKIAISQGLPGKWQWENENLSGEVFFGDETYLIKIYLKNSDIKLSETFRYYRVSNDTLSFSEIEFDANPTDIQYYLIKNITSEKLDLLDLSVGEIDHYTNLNHDHYELSKVNLDQFYFNGGIVCISNESRSNYNNCLNFNSISILSSIEHVEDLLGSPYTIVNQNGTEFIVYLLPSDSGSPPYLAISLNENKELSTIQISGENSTDEFSFSGIRLGDYFTMAEMRLGKPTRIEDLYEQTQLWSYNPFSISIEIKDNLVYSIKLTRK